MDNSTDSNNTNIEEAVENTESTENSIIEQAYKDLYLEQKKELENIKEELNKVKLANQKLAIQQNFAKPQQTAEELINDMFK